MADYKAFRVEVTRTENNAGQPSPAVGRFIIMRDCTPLDASGAYLPFPAGTAFSQDVAPSTYDGAAGLFDDNYGTRSAVGGGDDYRVAKFSYYAALPDGQTLSPRAWRLRQDNSGAYDMGGAWCTFRIIGVQANGTEDVLVDKPDDAAIAWEGSPPTKTFPVVGGGLSLSADPGTFTLTGQPATLRRGRVLLAAPGSFVLSGGTAGSRVDRRLSATPGTFTLTGSSAELRYGHRLPAQPGSFSLTGGATQLCAQRRLSAAAGNYTLIGGSTTLQRAGAIALSAQSGSFVLTGAAAGLVVQRRLIAAPGAFNLAGVPAVPRVTRPATPHNIPPNRRLIHVEVGFRRIDHRERGTRRLGS